MAGIRYCGRCKTIFMHGSGDICSSCLTEIEDIMKKVKKFMEEVPAAGIRQIAEGAKVRERDILFLLREGRLSVRVRTDSPICTQCGKRVETGKYCPECAKVIRMQLNKAADSLKEEAGESGKMYTMYRHKKKPD